MEPFRLTSHLSCYRPQRSCGQGFVFTRVCDSVHRGESPGRENPPWAGRTPLQAGRTPPWEQPPREQPPPRADPPPGRENPPPTRAGRTPPPRGNTLQHTVNERPVRILLECILALKVFYYHVTTIEGTVSTNYTNKI